MVTLTTALAWLCRQPDQQLVAALVTTRLINIFTGALTGAAIFKMKTSISTSGGISGDMFLGAMIDLGVVPALEHKLESSSSRLPPPVARR